MLLPTKVDSTTARNFFFKKSRVEPCIDLVLVYHRQFFIRCEMVENATYNCARCWWGKEM